MGGGGGRGPPIPGLSGGRGGLPPDDLMLPPPTLRPEGGGGGRGPLETKGNFLNLNLKLGLLPIVQKSAMIFSSTSCRPVRVDWFLPRDGGLSLGGGGRGPLRGGAGLEKYKYMTGLNAMSTTFGI